MTLLFNQTNTDGRLAAEYTLDEPLKGTRADLPLLLWVRVRNTGTIWWPCRGAYPINLGYHWLDAQGNVVDWEGVRTVMPVDLPPGEDVRLEVHAEPPPGPGQYQLMIDMVEEGVGWFSLQGVSPLIVPVTVAPAPVGAARACIMGALCLLNDAVGNTMLDQLRFFQRHGYQALIYVEHIDYRQPQELRQYMVRMSAQELQSGITVPYSRRGVAFFQSADLFVFNYAVPYVLFEAIQYVERGVVVLDYHGVTPHLWDGEGKEQFYAGFRRQQQLWHYADYAIAHSQFTRQDLLDSHQFDPARIYQMGYAVPLERFAPGPKSPALLARYGLHPDQPVLLYVGRIATNKRIEDVVRGLALVREQLPDAVLLIVGDNFSPPYAPVAKRVQSLADELGVGEALRWGGLVPNDELADHYRLADVFVTASIHEGFCIPVLEAMACGVPVVAAHATALPETVGDGGLTFRPEDAADLAAKVLTVLGDVDVEQRDKVTVDSWE